MIRSVTSSGCGPDEERRTKKLRCRTLQVRLHRVSASLRTPGTRAHHEVDDDREEEDLKSEDGQIGENVGECPSRWSIEGEGFLFGENGSTLESRGHLAHRQQGIEEELNKIS